MKYLCLIYCEEKNVQAMPKQDLDRISEDCCRYGEKLKQAGYFVASERLQPVSSAVTVRTSNGKVSITDGPFAETKEQLGGFYLIEADDQDEAIRIASKIPPGRLGCIEVRPVWPFGDERPGH